MPTDKKFFDIIPPGRSQKQTEAEQAILKTRPAPVSPKPEPEFFQEPETEKDFDFLRSEITAVPKALKKARVHRPFPKISLSRRNTIIVLIAFLLIALGSLAYYYWLPKVDIAIWLKTEVADFHVSVRVDKGQKTADSVNLVLPGKIVIEEQTVSQEFSSTGKIVSEQKAEGLVTIFNDYSTASQTLVATTRFVSSEGKLFRLINKIIVPGQTMENGKLVSGSVEVLVRADLAGEQYNIGPSTFSIPGLAGTPKYTTFYAKSSSAMRGGAKGEISAVSEKDLENAKKDLLEKIEQNINQALDGRVLPGFFLVRNGSGIKVDSEKFSAKEGDPVDSFTLELKARKEVILLAKDDLNTFLETYISSHIKEQERFLPETVNIEATIRTIDNLKGEATFNLTFSAKIYAFLDIEQLKTGLPEAQLQFVKQEFEKLPQVSRTIIKIFPFFINKLPKNQDKISLNVNFD
ncbi:MAG: hypothetical protein Q8N56_00930 [bacterium]|nr:hypothetical protein [bacterium]